MRTTYHRALVFAAAIVGVGATASVSALELSSPAFKHNEKIPAKYTCDGPGINPPLVFGAVPPGARQLILIMQDFDVPKSVKADGEFDHWLVWDISPDSKGIGEGQGAKMGINGTGKPGYLGPCPPDREHRYFFRLYALDASLAGQTFKNRAELEQAARGHRINQVELIGRYEKAKK